MHIDAVDILRPVSRCGRGLPGVRAGTKTAAPPLEDHFTLEIVDRKHGPVLPDGEEGELVFTS